MFATGAEYRWVDPDKHEGLLYCDVCKKHYPNRQYCQVFNPQGWSGMLCQPCMRYVAKRRDAARARNRNKPGFGNGSN